MHNSSHGPPSLADSAAEYFDASDDILCGSSSEVSDESGLSDGSTTNSEPEEGHGGYMNMKRVGRVQRDVFLINLINFIPSQPQPPGNTEQAFPSLQTVLFQRAPAGEQRCPPSVLTTVTLASWLSCTTT